MADLPRVSVLFITCNRAHTLVATYESFVRRVAYPRDRLELILCDDASSGWHRAIIDRLAFDKVVRSDSNRGLGANNNAGIAAAEGDFILSLQDDCMLIGDPDFLLKTISAFSEHPSVTMVGFRERPELPVIESLTIKTGKLLVYGTAANPRGCGDYAYSDQPHVKRRDFHARVGRYRENSPMAQMEMEFQRRVSACPGIKVAALCGPDPFSHIGGPFSLNEAVARASRREQFYRVPIIGSAYRRIRTHARRLFSALSGGNDRWSRDR